MHSMPPTQATAPMIATRRLQRLKIAALGTLFALATLNLSSWPATWFDEGSHLMVPKSLVLFGVYADYDSTGFRYFGPTTGVGPTVLLPIAVVFKIFGIGLLQARLVMAAYLVLAGLAVYSLSRQLMNERAALLAGVLFVATPGVGTLEFGRQVLGEVPGFFFLCLGLTVLTATRKEQSYRRLILAGVLLGLAAVTKYQLLVVILPGLVMGGVLSLWRGSRTLNVFVIPMLATLVVFGLWQICFMRYLGPSSFFENVRFVRRAASGAALAFSPERASNALRMLLEPGMLFGALVPAVSYGVLLAIRSDDRSFGWRVVSGFTLAALGWFVFASVGWRRYAYPGMALACLPAAAFFVEGLGRERTERSGQLDALRWTAVAWVTAMVVLGFGVLLPRIVIPRSQDAQAMARVVERDVARDAVIASWEPEMTFLTPQIYRVPPQELLPVAVAHVFSGGPPPSEQYRPDDWRSSGVRARRAVWPGHRPVHGAIVTELRSGRDTGSVPALSAEVHRVTTAARASRAELPNPS